MTALQGKTAIISGAGRGLGAAIARRFVAQGAAVLIADILEQEGTALAAELGERCRFVRLDVTDRDSWRAAVEECTTHLGAPTILVNNAGILHMAPLQEVSEEVFTRMYRVHMLGPLFGMQAVTEAMRLQGGGAIINISSTSGLEALNNSTTYTATKFALTGMTKVAAKELGKHNIRVNSVHPGTMRTEMRQGGAEGAPNERQRLFQDNLPLGRVAEPDEVAAMVAYLASDDAGYSTGSAFVVDGGMLAGTFGF